MDGRWLHKPVTLDESVRVFTDEMSTLGQRFGKISEHKIFILRHQLKTLQLPDNASLLALIKSSWSIDQKWAKKEALLSMVVHTLQAPIEKYVETLMPPPKIESEFTPGPEISCVFNTLVIRNEAINLKYEGGLKAFVSEHRVNYNNELSVMCFMGPADLDDALEMLENKGLKWEEDFTWFDATAISRKKPKVKTIPFKVRWLKGYCSKGYAHVCLVK
jgi:hypothetical protein